MLSAVSAHVASDAVLSGILTSGSIHYEAEGRIGKVGPAGFEADIGPTTATPADTANFSSSEDWQSGVAKTFTLTSDGSGSATLEIGGQSVSYSVGAPDVATDLFIRTRAISGATMLVDNLVLDNVAVADTSSAASGVDILRICASELADGFVLTGQATMSWSGTRPWNSQVAFQIKEFAGPVLESVTVTNANDSSQTATSTGMPGPMLVVSPDQYDQSTISVVGTVLPSAAAGSAVYALFDGGTKVADISGGSVGLDWSTGPQYEVRGAIDLNGNGSLDTGEETIALPLAKTDRTLNYAKPLAVGTTSLNPMNIAAGNSGTFESLAVKDANNNPETADLQSSVFTAAGAPAAGIVVTPSLQAAGTYKVDISVGATVAAGDYRIKIFIADEPYKFVWLYIKV